MRAQHDRLSHRQGASEAGLSDTALFHWAAQWALSQPRLLAGVSRLQHRAG